MNETYDLRIQSPLRFQRRGIVDVMETLEVLLRYIGSGNIFLKYFIDSNLFQIVPHALEAGINCAEDLLGRPVEYVGSAGRAHFSGRSFPGLWMWLLYNFKAKLCQWYEANHRFRKGEVVIVS